MRWVFPAFATCCCVLTELGDVSELIPIALLVVGVGVVVVSEFADSAEDR